MKSMEAGAPFNYNKNPNNQDISRNELDFATWWTPGQYAIPAIIKHILRIKLGQAITLTVVLFSALGAWGYFKLYRLLGFDSNLSASAIVIIILQRYFNLPFSIYIGGDVLLFGFIPWIMFFALKKRGINTSTFMIFISLSVLGFFLKSAFLVSFLAILLLLILIKLFKIERLSGNILLSDQPIRKMLNRDFLAYFLNIIAIATITFLVIHKTFLSKGTAPSSATFLNFSLDNIFFPIYGTILSSFSLDEIISKFIILPSHYYPLRFSLSLAYFVPAIISSLLLIALIFNKAIKIIYKISAISFFIVFFLFFSFHYFKGSTMAYCMRYFSPAGLLFLPGILYLFYRTRNSKFIKFIFSVFLFLNCLYGLSGFLTREFYGKSTKALSKDGFYHEIIDAQGLDILHRLDESLTKGNNLFCVSSPEIALDIKNNRWLPIHADFETIEDLSKMRYLGTTDNLFIFLQKHLLSNGKEKAIIESFKDYKKFELIAESPGFRILQGIK